MGEETVAALTGWNHLVNVANSDTEAGWNFIDKNLPELCTSPEIVKGALNGLIDSSQHVQDLSASTFEKQETEFFKRQAEKFNQLVPRLKRVHEEGSGPYAVFRAAFALFKHNYRSNDVVATVERAVADPMVGEIAKGYLALMKK